MDTFTATMIAEGVQEVESREEYLEAWQHLIDTGVCWQLQGWFGRTARDLILSGECKQPAAVSDKGENEYCPSCLGDFDSYGQCHCATHRH